MHRAFAFRCDILKYSTVDWLWLAIHLLSLTVPMILSITITYATFMMFIPIMGRAGSVMNPDILIGCKAVFMTLATIR